MRRRWIFLGPLAILALFLFIAIGGRRISQVRSKRRAHTLSSTAVG